MQTFPVFCKSARLAEIAAPGHYAASDIPVVRGTNIGATRQFFGDAVVRAGNWFSLLRVRLAESVLPPEKKYPLHSLYELDEAHL